MIEDKLNPTCLVTGSKENLRMHALRNKDGNMVGWVFLSDDVNILEIESEINWKYKISVK